MWESGSVTPNGAVGTSKLVMPQSQASQPLAPNFQALLNADNVQVAYTNNPYLSSFPKANWSPRIGAAYQIDNKTVARIGGGIFMGGFEPGGGAANVMNPPYILNASTPALSSCTQGSYCASQNSFGNTLEGGLGSFQGTGGIANHASFPSVSEEDPVMHMPYTMNYNLSVQRAFWKDTTATVSYVGSLGRHLVTGINNPDMPLADYHWGPAAQRAHAGAAPQWAVLDVVDRSKLIQLTAGYGAEALLQRPLLYDQLYLGPRVR